MRGYQGIRKNLKTCKFEAYKTIGGKKYFKQFDLITEAKKWRLNFVPETIIKPKVAMTFGLLLQKYKEEHLMFLESSTIGVKLDRLKIFDSITEIKLNEMDAEFVIQFFKREKEAAIKRKSRRKSFNEEIKDIKAIFNWYRENIDHSFSNPVINKRIKNISTIDPTKKQINKMTMEEFINFLNHLPEMFRDFAIIQSRFAARVSEVAGLQFSSIDSKSGFVTIQDVVVWDRQKNFLELKHLPKNKNRRGCVITNDMNEVFERRLKHKFKACDYVFHLDGQPLKYRAIQHSYDKALKDAGLSDRFSATHFVRHTMAFFARSIFKSLDYVQSITGHKSSSLAEHYSGLPTEKQGETMNEIERQLNVVQKNLISVGDGGQE